MNRPATWLVRALRSAGARGRPDPGFEPVRLLQLELADAAASEPAPADPAYRRARVLVRSHGRPVGAVDTDLTGGELGRSVIKRIHADLDVSGTPDPDVGHDHHEAMPGGLTATVVVATHNRPDQLRGCLDSVFATGYPELEVVVVDNAPSTEETRALVQRSYPGVRYVREDVPGLARAHNRALDLVRTPVVAFTDDDVVVDPGWVRSLVAAFAAGGTDVACVTGLIWPAELETATQASIEGNGAFGKGFARRNYDLRDHRPPDPLFPYTAGRLGSGANMAFRTRVLRETLGGFDPALGAGAGGRGGDDLAAFADVILAGHSLVYEPAAIVHHRHSRQPAAVRAQAFNYGVGLSAYLTRLALRRPAVLVDFARLAPRAVRHLLHGPPAEQPRPRRPRGDLPRQLLGMAVGPWAYARAVRDAGSSRS